MQHTAGDPAARTLYGTLLRAAGRPYVEMLQKWTRTGTLTDPYEEFCVKESRFINRGTLEMDYTDEYWERRYTVSRSITVSNLVLSRAPAARRLDSRLPEQTASSGRASAQSWEWALTWRSVHPPVAGKLEA